MLGDLPANLGVADLAVGRDGTVWIARYGALSLTAFDPATATFAEYPLPLASGDPARLSIAPGGDIFFTTDLAANHPGFGQETVGEFSPQTRLTWVYPQGAETIALTPQGDLYAAVGGPGYRLARLSATERAAAMAQHRVPVFQQQVTAFAIDGTALAADAHGRVWMAVAGQPRVAVLDPASGAVQFYQYAAPSVAAHPASSQVFGLPRTAPAPGTVWLVHIVAMTTDGQGHLWYVRAGSNVIEQVRA